MRRVNWLILVSWLGLLMWGCATAEPVRVEAPKVEPKVFYYVGALDLALKSAPDAASGDVARVTLNERVEQLQRSANWFQVRTDDGRAGWANEKYLALRPVSDLYVRRWGLGLKGAPAHSAKSVTRLRLNDRVKLLEKDSQGWAKVTVERTQSTGWLELKDLSVDRVVVRRVRKPKAGAAKPGEEEAGAEEAPEPSLLGPTPAEAAPPPAPKAPTRPKTRPEMFEPF